MYQSRQVALQILMFNLVNKPARMISYKDEEYEKRMVAGVQILLQAEGYSPPI
jgi:hypothetical protein